MSDEKSTTPLEDFEPPPGQAKPPVPPEAVPHEPDDDELSARWRAKVATRIILYLAMVSAVAVLASIALGVWAIRATQVSNTSLTKETHNSSDQIRANTALIRSCVDPQGECFKDAQRRTARFGTSQTDANAKSAAAAASCAARLADPSYVNVLRCELHQLAQGEHTGQ